MHWVNMCWLCASHERLLQIGALDASTERSVGPSLRPSRPCATAARGFLASPAGLCTGLWPTGTVGTSTTGAPSSNPPGSRRTFLASSPRAKSARFGARRRATSTYTVPPLMRPDASHSSLRSSPPMVSYLSPSCSTPYRGFVLFVFLLASALLRAAGFAAAAALGVFVDRRPVRRGGSGAAAAGAGAAAGSVAAGGSVAASRARVATTNRRREAQRTLWCAHDAVGDRRGRSLPGPGTAYETCSCLKLVY